MTAGAAVSPRGTAGGANPLTGKAEWQQPVVKDRNEALAWLDAGSKGKARVRELGASGRTFESIGDEWIAGVAIGRIGRRKRRGKPYTETTVRDYTRCYRNFVTGLLSLSL